MKTRPIPLIDNIPGSAILVKPWLAGIASALENATSNARDFGTVGKRIAGTPGQLVANMVGATTGAMSGFVRGSLSPLTDVEAAASVASGPAARRRRMENVFSYYLLGEGVFGDDPSYTAIAVDLYSLRGKWCGVLNGLQLNHTPPAKLFETPPMVDDDDFASPLTTTPVTEWTNGFYALEDGSTMTTEGIACSLLVPQRDGSLVFLLNNAHTIVHGSGTYEGARGIKQGLGAVYVPPGEFPGKFPAPGYRFTANSIDTFRLIKGSFVHPDRPFRAPEKRSTVAPGAPDGGAGASDIVPETPDPAFGESAYRLVLPPKDIADPRAYQRANLFRRYGGGIGHLSADGKRFRYEGTLAGADRRPAGSVKGVVDFVAPFTTHRTRPTPAEPPYTLETLSIHQDNATAHARQVWHFGDGNSLFASGSAVFDLAETVNGDTVLWISMSTAIAGGKGTYRGARGLQTTAMVLTILDGRTPDSASPVEVHTIDYFAVVPGELIGDLPAPGP